MGAVDVGGPKKAAGGPSWKRPRVNIRIDMTPMVDIAFLLLIFFMVTTVFRLPQTMEMALPENNPDKPPPNIKIAEHDLFTIYVMRTEDQDSLAVRIGNDPPRGLAWKVLSDTLIARRAFSGFTTPTADDSTPKPKLTVLAKIDRKASYESLVNLVDQFNVDSVTRFSIDRYTTEDDSLLRMVGFPTQGPAGLPAPVESASSDEG